MQAVVSAYRDERLGYGRTAPFDREHNPAYAAVEEVLRLAGLDPSNPFGSLVSPGQTVVIKPNWCRHFHIAGHDLFSAITHPAVLRPLVDYAFRAVGPRGRIWILDAPIYDTDFAELARQCQLAEFEAAMIARGVPLQIADLRSLVVRMEHGIVVDRQRRNTWFSEGVEFDLGEHSEFAGLEPHLGRLFGSDYDRRTTLRQHTRGRHCYRISRRVLEADLVISVPKLKTHKKTGVTLNVKNMIGINTDKNYIPHFRIGSPGQGGDEYPDSAHPLHSLRRFVVGQTRERVMGRCGSLGEKAAHAFMKGLLRVKRAAGSRDEMDVFYQAVQGDTCRSGNWWGNDTCWRAALDMNKILLYGTADGRLSRTRTRNYFSVVDGIVAGDGPGPLAPNPRREGVLLAGFDPLTVDTVATRIMGFEPDLIRDQRRARLLRAFRISEADRIFVRSNVRQWDGGVRPGAGLHFEPHPAWAEYFEGRAEAA